MPNTLIPPPAPKPPASVGGREFDNLGAWWIALGQVTLNRISFHPFPGTATEQDVLPGFEVSLAELFDVN